MRPQHRPPLPAPPPEVFPPVSGAGAAAPPSPVSGADRELRLLALVNGAFLLVTLLLVHSAGALLSLPLAGPFSVGVVLLGAEAAVFGWTLARCGREAGRR